MSSTDSRLFETPPDYAESASSSSSDISSTFYDAEEPDTFYDTETDSNALASSAGSDHLLSRWDSLSSRSSTTESNLESTALVLYRSTTSRHTLDRLSDGSYSVHPSLKPHHNYSHTDPIYYLDLSKNTETALILHPEQSQSDFHSQEESPVPSDPITSAVSLIESDYTSNAGISPTSARSNDTGGGRTYLDSAFDYLGISLTGILLSIALTMTSALEPSHVIDTRMVLWGEKNSNGKEKVMSMSFDESSESRISGAFGIEDSAMKTTAQTGQLLLLEGIPTIEASVEYSMRTSRSDMPGTFLPSDDRTPTVEASRCTRVLECDSNLKGKARFPCEYLLSSEDDLTGKIEAESSALPDSVEILPESTVANDSSIALSDLPLTQQDASNTETDENAHSGSTGSDHEINRSDASFFTDKNNFHSYMTGYTGTHVTNRSSGGDFIPKIYKDSDLMPQAHWGPRLPA